MEKIIIVKAERYGEDEDLELAADVFAGGIIDYIKNIMKNNCFMFVEIFTEALDILLENERFIIELNKRGFFTNKKIKLENKFFVVNKNEEEFISEFVPGRDDDYYSGSFASGKSFIIQKVDIESVLFEKGKDTYCKKRKQFLKSEETRKARKKELEKKIKLKEIEKAKKILLEAGELDK